MFKMSTVYGNQEAGRYDVINCECAELGIRPWGFREEDYSTR